MAHRYCNSRGKSASVVCPNCDCIHGYILHHVVLDTTQTIRLPSYDELTETVLKRDSQGT